MTGIIDDFERLRPALERRAKEGPAIPLEDVRLRPPLPRPGKILACIANYWEHGALAPRALNMFLKNPDAVIGPGDTIVLPEFSEPWIFMHEAELALVIKGPAKMVKPENWKSAVFGYTRRPAHVENRQLARQVFRHIRAARAVYRDARRDRQSQRRPRAVLGRRAAAAQLQHRRHGTSRAGVDRVRIDHHDAQFR
jgi:hypothetical protein